MINEGRKRDAAANALLGIAFAANAAQSPQALVRSGHIEGPGIQLMSRMMKRRGEANRNLDSGRVSHPARNRKKKTFEEFMCEAYLFEKAKTLRSAKVDEEFKQMPGKLMNKQMLKLQKSQSDLRKGRQTNKKREREIKYDKQMKSIMLASKQDYNEKGESYGKFYQDPLKTGKIRNHRFRDG